MFGLVWILIKELIKKTADSLDDEEKKMLCEIMGGIILIALMAMIGYMFYNITESSIIEGRKMQRKEDVILKKMKAFNAYCQPYHYLTTDQFDYIDVDIKHCKIVYNKKKA